MNCTDFVTRSSDYFDGSLDAGEVAAMEDHLQRCPTCRRYKTVYERGASLLRQLPDPELPADFRPRLQHRLFHVDDRRALIDNSGSAAPALTVLALAVVLSAVAWSPLLRDSPPVVELAPIVVERVVDRPAVSAEGAVRFATSAGLAPLDGGLWDDARLYEYTTLSRRYAGGGDLRRAGFDRR